MVYNELLPSRIRTMAKRKGLSEKKMFGGVAFLLNGKMCFGVIKDDLLVRLGPERHEDAIRLPHARPMDFTGRPMKGFVYVDSKGWSKYATLKKWLDMGADCTSSLRRKLWAEALLCDVDSAARHDGKVILTLGDYVNWVSKRILHNLLNTKDHRI